MQIPINFVVASQIHAGHYTTSGITSLCIVCNTASSITTSQLERVESRINATQLKSLSTILAEPQADKDWLNMYSL